MGCGRLASASEFNLRQVGARAGTSLGRTWHGRDARVYGHTTIYDHAWHEYPPPLKNAEVYPRLTFTSFELVFQGVYLLDDDGVDDDDDDDDYACDYDYYDYHVHQNVPMEENKCLYTINIIYYLI